MGAHQGYEDNRRELLLPRIIGCQGLIWTLADARMQRDADPVCDRTVAESSWW